MRIQSYYILIGFLEILFYPVYAEAGIKRPQNQRPNIIIILADDLGWGDVSYHGSEIKTPNIDRLVCEGIELDRYYVSPQCSPTRAGLMTGRHPLRYGMQSGVCSPSTRNGLPPKEVTLAEMLQRAGYQNRGCIGKWHLGHSSQSFDPLSQGFTYFYGHYNGALDYFTHRRCGELDWHENRQTCFDEGYTTDLLGQHAVEFIKESAGVLPFFLYVAFNSPHSPMQAKQADLQQYEFDPDKPIMENSSAERGGREGQPDYGDRGRGNDVRQTFSAMVAAMDDQVGKILKTLDEQSLRDNTLVLFHGDNGGIAHFGGSNKPLKGGKFTLWEGGVRVPAAIRWPARFKCGQKQTALMGCVDIWPTLAAIVGAEITTDYEIDGVNMLSVFDGTMTADPDRILYLGEGAATTQQWKWVNKQLFDVLKDPYETRNVADKHLQISEQLKSYIKTVESKAGEKFTLGPEKNKGWRPPENWTLPL